MPQLTCPLCRQPLAREANSFRCAQRHAFDLAREGYLNLLPVQHKKSRAPGDNEAMVRARRDFLAAGHYAPLREAAVAMLAPLAPVTLLDLGCGEGWYTAAFTALCADVCGLDISKAAIRLAARQWPGITWLVAGATQLPLADASVDVACSFFGPLPAGELARVLRPGGHLLLAAPAADHLAALRAALFDEVRPHEPARFAASLAPAFLPVATRELAVPLQLDARSLEALLLMTPYAWRAQPARRAALLAAPPPALAAAFSLQLYRRAD